MNMLHENSKIVLMSPGIAAHATTAGDCGYVSMKGYNALTILMVVDNATTVTGCAVTLKQATAVAGTGEKALSFDKMWALTDTSVASSVITGETLTETAVTSNTFTTGTTDNKNMIYCMEIKASDLDVANGFDCVRLDGLLQANSVSCVIGILTDPRYDGAAAITD